jgi:hypothetical protein
MERLIAERKLTESLIQMLGVLINKLYHPSISLTIFKELVDLVSIYDETRDLRHLNTFGKVLVDLLDQQQIRGEEHVQRN